MAGQHERGAMLERVLNAGQRGLDAFIAGDLLSSGRQWNVEVHAHENSFSVQIKIANRKRTHLFDCTVSIPKAAQYFSGSFRILRSRPMKMCLVSPVASRRPSDASVISYPKRTMRGFA